MCLSSVLGENCQTSFKDKLELVRWMRSSDLSGLQSDGVAPGSPEGRKPLEVGL